MPSLLHTPALFYTQSTTRGRSEQGHDKQYNSVFHDHTAARYTWIKEPLLNSAGYLVTVAVHIVLAHKEIDLNSSLCMQQQD
jgi:hypothetical protein